MLPSEVLVCVQILLLYFPLELPSEHPGPWEAYPKLCRQNHCRESEEEEDMAMQEIRQQLCKNYLDLGLLQQNLKFFECCVSEGLVPNGLRGTFNLAMNVNDEEFVGKAQ